MKKRLTKAQRDKRDRDRHKQKCEPLPAPFEHLDGHWWAGVIDDYEKATTKGEK